MGRGAAVSNLALVSAATGVSNPQSAVMNLLGVAAASFTVRLTPGSPGTLAGTAQLQVTDFGIDESAQGVPLSTDWVNQGTATTFSGSAIRINLTPASGKLARIVWADTGSTGGATLDMACTLNFYVDE